MNLTSKQTLAATSDELPWRGLAVLQWWSEITQGDGRRGVRTRGSPSRGPVRGHPLREERISSRLARRFIERPTSSRARRPATPLEVSCFRGADRSPIAAAVNFLIGVRQFGSGASDRFGSNHSTVTAACASDASLPRHLVRNRSATSARAARRLLSRAARSLALSHRLPA